MANEKLTVDRLLDADFAELGCWELDQAQALSHAIQLPQQGGVYAFAINGTVQYVGLASKSLRQRFAGYVRPGSSQPTNKRLNDLIRRHITNGSTIQILIAHPPDLEWNGFRIKGPEGLEAGLIAEFDLPWNMRGAGAAPVEELSHRAAAPRQSGVATKILEMVNRRPGMTELEIAKAIYGPTAVQQQVNSDCRLLVGRGQLERRGHGGRSDPFTYHPAR